jgi:hypothetical protein
MSVGGSGGADDMFDVPDLGGSRGRKTSAATDAAQKRNREAEGVKESPVDVPATSAAKAKLSVDEKHILQEQAKYIAFTQSKTAAREFSAGAIGGVSGAAIEEARKFLLPGKMLQMSAAEIEKARAEERFIRATKGSAAARDFRLKEMVGLSEKDIEDIRQFDIPEPEKPTDLRNTIFGGFSAFGLVQTALASFANSLKIATDNLNAFVSTAITGESPGVGVFTGPPRAALAAAPGIGVAAGAGIGALATSASGPGALGGGIVGGAIGFGVGTALQYAFDPLLQAFESLDSAIQQYTDSLVGISPAVTQVSVEQTIRRLERQFERSDIAGDRLASISEARFRLEEAFFNRGTQLIISIGPVLELVFNALAQILEDPTEFIRIILRIIKRLAGRMVGDGGFVYD